MQLVLLEGTLVKVLFFYITFLANTNLRLTTIVSVSTNIGLKVLPRFMSAHLIFSYLQHRLGSGNARIDGVLTLPGGYGVLG